MREKSREKNSQENKRQSKVRRMIISASFVLAFLIVLTANEALQARATQDANENRAYRSDESALRKVQVGDIEIAYKLFGKAIWKRRTPSAHSWLWRFNGYLGSSTIGGFGRKSYHDYL